MRSLYSIIILLLTFFPITAFCQNFFLSLEGTFGRHNVEFKEFTSSPGASFGFKVSAGFLIVDANGYCGGPQYTLVEGASFNNRRRQLSEDFDLPNKDYDKHIVYNFAMFRSSNIGWASFIDIGNSTLYHQIGFGIFGLTENDPLFNFGLNNQLGIQFGQQNYHWRIGFMHDWTIGNGNPNYSISNLGLNFGVGRSI